MNVMFPKCYTPHAVTIPAEFISTINKPRYIDINVGGKVFTIDLYAEEVMEKFRRN